jgi:hypothetical protein
VRAACPVPPTSDDDAAVGLIASQRLGEYARYVPAGEAVKAIAPRALGEKRAAARSLSPLRAAQDEGRTEAGNLWRCRIQLRQCVDGGKMVRLVQWRERDQAPQFGRDGCVDSDRRCVAGPAADDTASHPGEVLDLAGPRDRHGLERPPPRCARSTPPRRPQVELGRLGGGADPTFRSDQDRRNQLLAPGLDGADE